MLEISSISSEYLTVSGVAYRISDLGFEDLRSRFSTGQAYTKSGSGRDRVMGYRHGVMTNIGDLEESVWEALLRGLIHRSGEDELLRALIEWSASAPWLRTQKEIEKYALELHSSRIFDNKNWVGYREFNERYRPEKLKKEQTHEYCKKVP